MEIKFSNVNFQYDKKASFALKDVNLSFSDGEIVFILGHTGSGKSTLVQLINGLLFPVSGEVEVRVDDKKYLVSPKEKKIKELRKNIGLVFQYPENQLFESTVLKDVMYGPRNFGYSREESETQSKEALTLLGIDESYYNRSPFELSGGEKRRVAIAGVLASKPRALIFDEPTSSLDQKGVKDFFNLVEQLKKSGCIVIIVSHDVDLTYEYADKVVILNEGVVSYYGNYSEAFDDENIIKGAKLDLPFIVKAQRKLKLDKNIRSLDDLSRKGDQYE